MKDRGGPDVIGQLRFPISFTALNVVVLIALTLAYWYEGGDAKETLVFLATGAAAVGVIVSAFYTAKTLIAILAKDEADQRREQQDDQREQARETREAQREAREKQREDRELAREASLEKEQRRVMRQLALRFGERYNDPSMFHVRDVLREITITPRSPDELITYVNHETRITNVIHIFNFLEEIAIAHSSELVDQETLKAQFHGIVVKSWGKLAPWVETIRKDRGDKRIWDHVESLYDVWKKDKI